MIFNNPAGLLLCCVLCQVLEAAVVGIPHPKWGERPLLVVVPQPEHAPGETSGGTGGCGHSSTQGNRAQPGPQATKVPFFEGISHRLQGAAYGHRRSAGSLYIQVSVREVLIYLNKVICIKCCGLSKCIV